MRRHQLPSVRQLDLAYGRTLTLPTDEDGSYDDQAIELRAVVVDLSPEQSRWMGVDPPRVAGCPGCLLFGCCALHDTMLHDTQDHP